MLDFYLLYFIMCISLLSGLFVFSSTQKHLLVTLLSLEYLMLNIFLLLGLAIKWDIFSMPLLMVFLVFSVSEGSLGLSILVSLFRSHGADTLKSYSMVW